jgi:hypothetical protein
VIYICGIFELMIVSKLKIYFLFYSAMFLSQNIIAQNEFNNWHFGNGATLNFNGGSPTAGSNSSLSTSEGSAAVSDCQGNLLFYTDGITVWNKNNNIMSYGTGLDGGPTSSLGIPSSQGALIVKRPETTDIYYIFTASSSKGLKYSVVNMSLNDNLGDVLVKNIVLDTNRTEQLAVTYHSNLKDIWVVTHYDETNQYESFLITKDGIIPKGVSSFDGDNYEDSHGDLKISRDGSKIGSVIDFTGRVYLGDFNNTTGVVSNTESLSGFSNPHGVEFSPDNSKMYVNSTSKGILQFSIVGTNAQILNNYIAISSTNDVYGSLQLGPDNRIYVANNDASYLGIIVNPNAYGNAANYVEKGIFIGSSRSGWGITNVTLTGSNLFNGPNTVQFIGTCENHITKFSLTNESNIVDVLWEFGDTSSAVENYSIEINPEHQYTGVGLYNVSILRTTSMIFENSAADNYLIHSS